MKGRVLKGEGDDGNDGGEIENKGQHKKKIQKEEDVRMGLY